MLSKEKEKRNMLRELLRADDQKECTFQTMLLKNDASREVEILEDREVDFGIIQEHLRQGDSVFITSKPAQKLTMPTLNTKRAPRKRKAVRTVTALYFDHV